MPPRLERSNSVHSVESSRISERSSELLERDKSQGNVAPVATEEEQVEEEVRPLTKEEKRAKRKEQWEKIKEKILRWRVNVMGKIIEGNFYSFTMLFATVWALFFQDILDAALPKSLDAAWGVINTIVFSIFVLDLFLSCIGKPGYALSLFFFLDVLATLSMVPDVPYIWNPFLDAIGQDSDTASTSTQSAIIARVGRAARAGTRAGRLVRLFKIVAIATSKNKARSEIEQSSVVGKKLADLTTRKVIIGVMLMVAIIPLLSADQADRSKEYNYLALNELAEFEIRQSNITLGPNSTLVLTPALQARVDEYVRNYESTILTFYLWGVRVAGDDTDYLIKYRKTEVLKYLNESGDLYTEIGGDAEKIKDSRFKRPKTELVLQNKRYAQMTAVFNIVLTILIVGLLSIGSFLFGQDANNLMIRPISRMVRVVKLLADNPLARLDDEDSESTHGSTQNFETSLVEAALRKIGMLLQIGFGEAGAEIIGKNLGSGGQVNPMLPGVRCQGVFGFCDIRNFTDATECLQADVMVFVNVIADIVHMAVKRHGGSPNKNIGDAFLVVYKSADDPLGSRYDSLISQNKIADGGLQAFLDVINEVNANKKLHEFAKHPAIQARMPGYKVKMGFGLHFGWAIEGAIGSSLKIDASYLSPHVNIAARLESATKAYGTPMLISGALVRNLSPNMRPVVRKIDKVTLKGSKEPMELFCVDLDPPPKGGKYPGIKSYTKKFEAGVQAYINGNWSLAGDTLQKCLEMWPSDEPANNLLWYMSRYNFKPPANWAGFRELTEK